MQKFLGGIEMRKKFLEGKGEFKILVVDDEQGIVDSLKVVLSRLGYEIIGETNPVKAVEMIRNEHYDLLILDFLMDHIRGDQVVEKIREFNQQLFILLLTGYKDMAPPLETIKTLDIQGYCEKSDKFDQLILFVESALKAVSLMRKNKKFEDGLNKIIHSIPKIYQLQPLGNIMEEILNEILPFANSENAFILIDDLYDGENSDKTIFRGIGNFKTMESNSLKTLSADVLETIGHTREEGRSIMLPTGVVLPIVNEEAKCIGVIFVESNQYKESLGLLEIFSKQSGASISNAILHSLVNTKKEELKKTYEELRKNYLDIIETLRLAVDAKDIYTSGHSERVSFYSIKIGEQIGLTQKELELLKVGGQFHDIGKIGLNDGILLKPGKLNEEEFCQVKEHPIKGAYILSAISSFNDIIPMVKYHHERMDGRGYPEGLKGEDIPKLARIVCIADAFDAMTSDRHYRSKMFLEEAIEQLLRNSGTQFDPYFVEVFVNVLRENHVEWIDQLEPTFSN